MLSFDPSRRSLASSSNFGAVQLAERGGNLDADAHRPEGGAVGHDHEHALALLAGVLAGRSA